VSDAASISDAPSSEAPSLTTEQLTELLDHLRGADSVELKLSVPDGHRRSAVKSLRMDPIDAQIRQVAFFDTPDLDLSRGGVVVRVRRVQGKPADSVVKLRPVVPDDIEPTLRASPAFGVEVDAMPGGFVTSASMKAEVDPVQAKQLYEGAVELRKVLSKEQRRFYDRFAPAETSLNDLAMLGPINVLKLKFEPAGFRRMVAELWLYPDGSRVLELSTKCAPAETFDTAARAKAFLAGHGIDLGAPQQTKTRTAMEFFAAELVTGGTAQ
jgi:hypothetical protein